MMQFRNSLLLALPMLLLATTAGAGNLRPVSELERQMTSVPEAPNAPAVVLFKNCPTVDSSKL